MNNIWKKTTLTLLMKNADGIIVRQSFSNIVQRPTDQMVQGMGQAIATLTGLTFEAAVLTTTDDVIKIKAAV